jgi:hypothetical protein
MMVLDALATTTASPAGIETLAARLRDPGRNSPSPMERHSNRKPDRKTDKIAQLGDLVALAFEEAQRLTSDPTRAAALAADAVRRVLLLRGDARLVRMLATS